MTSPDDLEKIKREAWEVFMSVSTRPVGNSEAVYAIIDHLHERGLLTREGFVSVPEVPEGYALVKLGRFRPNEFSPATFIVKTNTDRIRVSCIGEKNSYSFSLPIAAAPGGDE